MSRPEWNPTEKDRLLVKVLRAGGMEQQRVAGALGVSLNTLKRYCKEELACGKSEIDGKVMGALVKNALQGNVVAQIFYLKTRCGWREVGAGAVDRELPRFVVKEIGARDEKKES